MVWISEKRRVLRVGLLALLFVALLGPWVFDTIYVPAEYDYACSAPNVRLNQNLCGIPLSGMRVLFWLAPGIASVSAALLRGTADGFEWVHELLFCLLLFIPVAPFFTTSVLLWRGDRRRLQVLNLIAWALAGGVGLLIVLSYLPGLPPLWSQWGVWLAIGLAVVAITLEVLILVVRPHPSY